jgi:hypothetical protein
VARRLDWDKARRDNAASRRYWRRKGAAVKKDREKPASDKQLGYVKHLRARLARPESALPKTAYQAYVEIEHLKRLLDGP